MRHIVATLIALCIAAGCGTTDTNHEHEEKNDVLRGMWGADSIIDIHGHTGTFKGYDLSIGTLRSNIDSFGIRLVLISNVDGAHLPGITLNSNAVSANRATEQLIREHPLRLRGLLWTRPADGLASDIEPFLKDESLPGPNPRPFVGIKLHPVMNQFPADGDLVDPYFELAESFGVPIVFHSDKPGTNGAPEKIYAAARRHPTVPVILYHMVFFGPHDSAIDVVERATARGDADLYLETSQADTAAVLSAIARVGSERVLFGSDATYFGEGHYASYLDLVGHLRAELSEADFRRVMRENAKKLFRLWENTE
jgi:predicted TIM-barrel fold metal-dependent hydrolase